MLTVDDAYGLQSSNYCTI